MWKASQLKKTTGTYQLWSRRNNNYSINIQSALLMKFQTYRNLNMSKRPYMRMLTQINENSITHSYFLDWLLFTVPQRTRKTSSLTFGIHILMNWIIYLQNGRRETESRSKSRSCCMKCWSAYDSAATARGFPHHQWCHISRNPATIRTWHSLRNALAQVKNAKKAINSFTFLWPSLPLFSKNETSKKILSFLSSVPSLSLISHVFVFESKDQKWSVNWEMLE